MGYSLEASSEKDTAQLANAVLLHGVFLKAMEACPDVKRAVVDSVKAGSLRQPPAPGVFSDDENGQSLSSERQVQRDRAQALVDCQPLLSHMLVEVIRAFSSASAPESGLLLEELENLFTHHRLYPGEGWLSLELEALVAAGILVSSTKPQRYALALAAPPLEPRQQREMLAFRLLNLAAIAGQQRITTRQGFVWTVGLCLPPEDLNALALETGRAFLTTVGRYRRSRAEIKSGQEHLYLHLALGGVFGRLSRKVRGTADYRSFWPILCSTLGSLIVWSIGSHSQGREVLQTEIARHLHAFYPKARLPDDTFGGYLARQHGIKKPDTIWNWKKHRGLTGKNGQYLFRGGNVGDAQVAILDMLADVASVELPASALFSTMEARHPERMTDRNVVRMAIQELMRLRCIVARTGEDGEIRYGLERQIITIPYAKLPGLKAAYLEDFSTLAGEVDGLIEGDDGHHGFFDECFVEAALFDHLVQELRGEKDSLYGSSLTPYVHIPYESHEAHGLHEYRYHLLGKISSVSPRKGIFR